MDNALLFSDSLSVRLILALLPLRLIYDLSNWFVNINPIFIPRRNVSSVFCSRQKSKCQVSKKPVGPCSNYFFHFFYFFWKRRVIPDSRFSESRFLQGLLFDFSSRIWTGWPASQSRSGLCSRFFSCFIQIFYVFPCIVENRALYWETTPTKACCDEAAVSTIAASWGRRCPPPRLSLRD